MSFGRVCLFGILGVGLLLSNASPAPADDPPYEEGVAPLYLMVSFDDSFVIGKKPSQVIVVNVGSLVGGDGTLDTRLATDQALTTIPLPDGNQDPTFEEIADNSATLVGSFQTLDLGEIHMVTPAPGTISPDIQQAVYTASHEGLIDDLLLEDPYPTTIEIADLIVTQLPAGSTQTRANVLAALFNSGSPLNSGNFGASITGEGEMFPHAPDSDSIYHWSISFDEDGTFEQEFLLRISIDVHPGSTPNPVNIKNKGGEVPVAILSRPDFDPADLDGDTVAIGGVAPTKLIVQDKNGDGVDDLVYHWNVGDLLDAGAVTADSTSITVRATLLDGAGVIGTDAINIEKK